jgi:2-hydroxychromene-2-carboxylate isomerase
LADAQGSEAKSTYDKNVVDAIAADVSGSPSYVLDGEVFWGQDRIDLLEGALKSERRPCQPDA